MCGGFTCSKNTLIGLNIVYIFVAFLLIGVAAAAKSSNYVTSLPIVGGIVACGVFLLFISIVGLYGAVKHHQITLFFYMVVLFAIFVIQFSVACASLAASTEDELNIIKKAWDNSHDSVINDFEVNLNCCGFNDHDDHSGNCKAACVVPGTGNKTDDLTNCKTCKSAIKDKVDYAFNSAGWCGLFFAFTELVAIVYAHRFRTHLKNQIA